MKLQVYLDRIRFRGEPKPDLPTLTSLMQAHINTVPFENLDVQLGKSLTTDVEEAFDKIVTRRRGGWCYEMNGLFGWVLSEIGFEITRLGAGVMRQQRGDDALGNHLCLLVDCNGPYLVDVGFGGVLCQPLPLQKIHATNPPYTVSLSQTGDGFWRFTEILRSEPFSFDFSALPADEELLNRTCQSLQTDPESSFVLNLVAQMRKADTHISLRGRLLQHHWTDRTNKKLINSPDELVGTLKSIFNLEVPEVAGLWPHICKRHDDVFRDTDPTASQE